MKSFKFCLMALALFVLTSSLVYGQATRTWVSGVGDDANPCSRTAPCKTFAGAISKTAPGGEIDALDPGGFGALTITKSITLDGGGGQVASVLVAGTNGIVVAAGSTDVVIIRNLRLDGLKGASNGNAGLNGIRFISGAFLSIENCDIFGFNQNGIDLENNQNSNVQVKNTTSTNNAGRGLFANTSAGTIKVSVDSSYFSGNGQAGVWADKNSFVTVSRSVADNNTGIGFIAQGNGGSAIMDVTSSITTGNGVGLQAGGGTNISQIFVNGTYVGSNTAGLVNGVNGTSSTYGTGTNPFKDTPNTFTGTAQPIK
jgi:hypothetical protein